MTGVIWLFVAVRAVESIVNRNDNKLTSKSVPAPPSKQKYGSVFDFEIIEETKLLLAEPQVFFYKYLLKIFIAILLIFS